MRLLYDYPELDPELYFNDAPGATPLYSSPDMGLINDRSYCDYTDSFNVAYPSNIDSAMNVLSDYNSDGLAREIFKTHGNDVMPDNVHKDMNETEFNQVRNTKQNSSSSFV